jgi:hypothetical protein
VASQYKAENGGEWVVVLCACLKLIAV